MYIPPAGIPPSGQPHERTPSRSEVERVMHLARMAVLQAPIHTRAKRLAIRNYGVVSSVLLELCANGVVSAGLLERYHRSLCDLYGHCGQPCGRCGRLDAVAHSGALSAGIKPRRQDLREAARRVIAAANTCNITSIDGGLRLRLEINILARALEEGAGRDGEEA